MELFIFWGNLQIIHKRIELASNLVCIWVCLLKDPTSVLNSNISHFFPVYGNASTFSVIRLFYVSYLFILYMSDTSNCILLHNSSFFYFMLTPWIHCLFWFWWQQTLANNEVIALDNLKVLQTLVSPWRLFILELEMSWFTVNFYSWYQIFFDTHIM